MPAEYLHFAPDVPGLSALGASSFADLMGDAEGPRGLVAVGPARPGERRDPEGARDPGRTFRFPLPGTPDASGRLTGRPCGAGTGWVRLRRFEDARLGETLAARFGAPRSLSLAEREWNLICHLRAHGVGAPDPLAFGREGGAVFARRSFLVTRELEGFRSLAEVAAEERDPALRRRVARAVGTSLARLFRSGTHLPALDAEHVLVSRVSAPGERVEALGMAAGRLPEVVLTGLAGGRIGAPPTDAEREELLRRLRAELGGDARDAELLRAGTRAAREVVARGRCAG